MERIHLPANPRMILEFDETNQGEFGPCPDCGETTKRVWGYVYDHDAAAAAYFVEWTPSHKPKDAMFDLIIGRWGEQAGPNDRKAVAVSFRVLDSGPSFMVQDANTRRVGSSSFVSHALKRDEVIGTQIANEVFAICDLIYLGDSRLKELRS